MPKHIGIVACSAEGAALCYRTICLEASAYMGEHAHPEITMHTFPLSDYMEPIRIDEWDGVTDLMLRSARKVVGAGADFLICPDNTLHQVFDAVIAKSPAPWIHIADAVGEEARRRGFDKVGILGTKYLMTGPVYPQTLARLDVECLIPGQDDRERINDVIFRELVNGVFKGSARLFFNTVIKRLKERGCDAAVLGCTEIPLLVDADDSPLPVLDSTRLLAKAALRRALE
ncbi:MAG: amino acid racemase [Candidatus Krumholzibacteria bacterium]|nr:amino acid racemase [Candidatus Krumholzibacteria bacterium]